MTSKREQNAEKKRAQVGHQRPLTTRIHKNNPQGATPQGTKDRTSTSSKDSSRNLKAQGSRPKNQERWKPRSTLETAVEPRTLETAVKTLETHKTSWKPQDATAPRGVAALQAVPILRIPTGMERNMDSAQRQLQGSASCLQEDTKGKHRPSTPHLLSRKIPPRLGIP
jgi:hypothetical protein